MDRTTFDDLVLMIDTQLQQNREQTVDLLMERRECRLVSSLVGLPGCVFLVPQESPNLYVLELAH